MKSVAKDIWDVAVLGGGAAGMMAAGRAAESGARVILIEKNPTLGTKLLITGGGRCNITNAEPDLRTLLSKFNSRDQSADQFLFSPFSRHGVADSLAFFNNRGLPTKTEARGRVFPITDSAQSVWDVLRAYMAEHSVHILSGVPVVSITHAKGQISYVTLVNDQRVYARTFIFATGGLSRPETGSTGDGFTWLRELGHTVAKPNPSLVPLTLKDTWVPSVAGVSLPNSSLSILEDGRSVSKQSGGLLFTHQGISGPAALNLSRDVGERLPYAPVTLKLDLLPSESLESVDTLLQESIASLSNRMIRNVLSSLIPTALASVVLTNLSIDPETPAHSLTREQRIAIGKNLKGLLLSVKGRLGFEKAIIASGGVPLTEIDTRTMRSKVIENLYVVGDLLHIDRPSGGYSLQLCWTTGTVAGIDAAERSKS
jgi:predicted Rossmann fold flavoprotein